ncbi:Uncharacterized protein DAT39_022621 [Clarias magur]|uniref:Uncharacterized protein n=1 Tax=Clarias magur TaxID=1594786 RepID=A0A8J4TU66_CLAMG|nr:Uncharacterized protein DAT39_022621 [Clarias magur]
MAVRRRPARGRLTVLWLKPPQHAMPRGAVMSKKNNTWLLDPVITRLMMFFSLWSSVVVALSPFAE